MRIRPSLVRFVLALGVAASIAWFAPARMVHAADDLPGPFDAASIKRTADACTNFFDFATGGWRAAHPIPAAYTEYGYIERLQDETEGIVRATLEAAMTHPGAAGSTSQKIGDFYGSCMDTAAIERQGISALDPELARDDAASQKLRDQYVAHVAAMLALAGDASAAQSAHDVMTIETVLAQGSLTAVERRDPKNTDHPMKSGEVAALMPHFNFTTYLRETHVPVAGTMNVATPKGSLGMDVGQAYVAKTFPPSAKKQALDMTLRMRDAYRAEMSALPWMSEATRATAIAKLNAMGFKVGYPDVWKSYAGYTVEHGNYTANVLHSIAFERAYQLGQIDKPVNHNEWGMTPQTVNAYNSSSLNEIVLPAAQLQRPFFDDQGHKYDLHGNLTNWWTPDDLAHFDERANCVIKQFDNAIAVGDTHYQGKLVAGEAIADLGGVVIGYRALESSLGNAARKPIDGYTPEQRGET